MAVAIGLRSKTGRAIAVVLDGSKASPRVLSRHDLILFDPKFPETVQPHHQVMHLPWPEAEAAARKSVAAIQKMSSNALKLLIREVEAGGAEVQGIGIVGSADRPLEKIGNYHIRAHAAEGILYRRVLDVAADSLGLPRRNFVEKELLERAATELKRPAAELRRSIEELGRKIVRPWRAEEKAAATAAWLALARRR